MPAGTDLASPWLRLGAYLLDVLLLVVTLIIGWIIWTLIVWKDGQSPAKRLLGMRVVVKSTGRTATWGKMFLREFVMRGLLIPIVAVPTCGVLSIVAVLMIFSAYHETLWDKWSGTLVVKQR